VRREAYRGNFAPVEAGFGVMDINLPGIQQAIEVNTAGSSPACPQRCILVFSMHRDVVFSLARSAGGPPPRTYVTKSSVAPDVLVDAVAPR
jgi:hypothetical protein